MGHGKHVEKVLSRMPEPSANQRIVCVTGTPGGPLLQVVDAEGRNFLCRVPTKFRNKVWVIKGGHLIVDMEQGDEEGDAVGKVQATLANHLYRDQVRHLQARGLWPEAFETEPPTASVPAPVDQFGGTREYGNEYGALGADGDLFVNRNRGRGLESDDEDEGEEEEEEGTEGDEEEEEEGDGETGAGATAAAAASDPGIVQSVNFISQGASPSFVDSPFATKVDYEAFMVLPADQRVAALEEATKKASAAPALGPVHS